MLEKSVDTSLHFSIIASAPISGTPLLAYVAPPYAALVSPFQPQSTPLIRHTQSKPKVSALAALIIAVRAACLL